MKGSLPTKPQQQTLLSIGLLAVLLYFPLFFRLDTLVIQLWDESRLAINAYEMLQNGNYLVTHFEGKPDMWNTKPPLMIWLQVATMQLLGATTLAVRLPAALAALATLLLMLYFAWKHLNSRWYGAIALLILLTTQGFVRIHCSRTGDYDSLLTLFTTTYLLSFFLYTQFPSQRKYLHYGFLALSLALLTKGISACFFLPAIALYALLSGKLSHFLRQKYFYIDALLVFVSIAAYYFLREQYNPGYWNAVGENELWGRFGKAIEQHQQPFEFYFRNWATDTFTYWYVFLLGGIVLGMSLKNDIQRHFTYFLTLCSATYMLVISAAQTKLTWYDMPVYPLLAFLTANVLYWLLEYLQQNPSTSPISLQRPLLPYVFLSIAFVVPYLNIIKTACYAQEPDWASHEYEANYYLVRKATATNIAQWKVLCDAYAPHLDFYVQTLSKPHQQFIRQRDAQHLQANDHVIVRQDHLKAQLEANYQYQIIDTYKNANIYKIIGNKNNTPNP